MKNIKILFLGSGNINPINVLTKNLIQFGTNNYIFDGLNLYEPGAAGVNTTYKHITNLWRISKRTVGEITIKEQMKLLIKGRLLTPILKILFSNHYHIGRSWLKYSQLITSEDWTRRMLEKINDYDFINAHYLCAWQSEIIPLIPPSKRVTISFWGSDLMASAGKYIYQVQFDALQRADAISTIPFEMEQIILSKFGRNLKSKIHHTFFGLTQDVIDDLNINKARYKQIGANLLKLHNINPVNYKYLIKLGYSSFETHNHIPIINHLGKLPYYLKSQICLVIPMTYGNNKSGYKEKVESSLMQNEISGVVFKEYLSHEEAVSLSFITNIMFNLRDSDAFNNSMSESLIAGSIVFNGIWLPYKMLQERGINYITVNSIIEIAEKLELTIQTFEKHINLAKQNAEKLNNWISGQGNTQKWEQAILGLIH